MPRKYHEGHHQRAQHLAWEGMSLSEISREMDIPQSTVYGWLNGSSVLGPNRKRYRELDDETVGRVLEIMSKGGLDAVRLELRVSEDVIKRYIEFVPGYWRRKSD